MQVKLKIMNQVKMRDMQHVLVKLITKRKNTLTNVTKRRKIALLEIVSLMIKR